MATSVARVGTRPRAKVRRGRPSAEIRRDVRDALLTAARSMFLQYGYRAVSARQVAVKAGVDPAMVQYYFKGKRGLYVAMLDATIAPLRASLEEMNAATTGSIDLPRFLQMYMRTIAANPWMPALLIREVLPPEGAFRNEFIESVVRPLAGRLLGAVRRAQKDGVIDRALRPEFVLVTFLSLGLWPFLVRPILPRVIGLTLEGAEVDALVEHARRSFVAAVGAKR